MRSFLNVMLRFGALAILDCRLTERSNNHHGHVGAPFRPQRSGIGFRRLALRTLSRCPNHRRSMFSGSGSVEERNNVLRWCFGNGLGVECLSLQVFGDDGEYAYTSRSS